MFSTSHLHPMLVHFPIALIAIGFLAEFAFLLFKKEICLTKMGYYLLVVGTLAACVTWLSGDLFTSDMEGAAGKVRETHELLATVTVVISLLTVALRTYMLVRKQESQPLKVLAFVLYALAALSVSATGFFGGTLVYNYMMPL
ncbi:MAG: DUF2231 domain-containing protein [Paludibacter sp.]|nr:DUF2231 domain-containing protein [Paludibacter sp.]